MKKVVFILLSMMLTISVMAQQKIQLRSADRAECTKSDMTSLQASFSFSTVFLNTLKIICFQLSDPSSSTIIYLGIEKLYFKNIVLIVASTCA